MNPLDLALLFALAAIWGGSFLFIKVAVQDLSPLMLTALRLVLASASLLIIRGVLDRVRPSDLPTRPLSRMWKSYLFVAVTNAIVPYTLIAWGEESIASGTASILNATTPLFTALLAASAVYGAGKGEGLTARGLTGLLTGFAGVAVVVAGSGADLSFVTGRKTLLGYAAVLVASAAYGAGGLYGRRAFAGMQPIQPALWQNVFGAVLLLPAALLLTPLRRTPSPEALWSVVALGVGGTGVALVLYYALLARVGATRTVMVTYLLPIMAVVYGAAFLEERVGASLLLGLVLVLSGIAITARSSGAGRVPARPAESRS